MKEPAASQSDLRLWRAMDPAGLSADQKNALIRDTIQQRAGARISASRDSDAVALADARLAKRLTEAKLSTYDPDEFLSSASGGGAGWRPTGDRKLVKRKDIPPALRLKILATMSQLWDSNPLARRMVERLVNYLMGDGVKLVSTEGEEGSKARQDVQDVLDAFWDDGRNMLDRRMPRWLKAYFAYGELCLRATQNPATGLVRLAFVSPEQVHEVITEPDDVEQLSKIVVASSSATGSVDSIPLNAVAVREEQGSGSEAYGRLDGEVFFWAANTLPDMVRGRPSQLVVADFLDADEQAIWNGLERGALANAFVWDVTLSGKTESEITTWQMANGGVPKPGSVVAHNENVAWAPLSVDLKTGDSIAQHDLLVGVAAMALGMPAMWFTAQSDPNRANGDNLTGPTLRDMTAVQKEVRAIVEDLATFALDAAVRAGVLPKTLRSRRAFNVEMPELSTNDTAVAAGALGGIVSAGIAGKDGGLLSEALARRMVRLVATQLGIEVDGQEEDKALQEAADRKAAEEEAMGGFVPGGQAPQEPPMPEPPAEEQQGPGQLVPFRRPKAAPGRGPTGRDGTERQKVVSR